MVISISYEKMFFFSPFPGIIGLTAHKNSHDLKLILPFLTMDANGVLRQTNLPYCNHWSSAKESPIPAGDQYFDRIVIYLLGLKTGNLQFAKYRCSIPLSRIDGQITSIMRVYYTSIFGQFVLFIFFFCGDFKQFWLWSTWKHQTFLSKGEFRV